ncbi:DUF6390 family protein [Pseudonocardia alni]|uniref:DUF6390 family protein n=1 Tax=Pseudonocardia alni TaxID=33907 RepID=UPI0036941C5A
MTAGTRAVADVRGVEMFARYAYAPNRLGYCGPPGSGALAAGAVAGGSTGSRTAADPVDVRAAARRFSGAWPYLQVLARLTGSDDPLDYQLVESYWLGRDLGIDTAAFGAELLAVIGPQAGHYWTHLTPELLAGATCDHSFHVFGVYPWTRLLGKGMDAQPLRVLDSCRIRWGTVESRSGDEIEVRSRRLSWDGRELGLAEATVERVRVSVDGLSFVPDVAPGDEVALHWDWLTDRLTPEQARVLERSTERELAATNRRLVDVGGQAP